MHLFNMLSGQLRLYNPFKDCHVEWTKLGNSVPFIQVFWEWFYLQDKIYEVYLLLIVSTPLQQDYCPSNNSISLFKDESRAEGT